MNHSTIAVILAAVAAVGVAFMLVTRRAQPAAPPPGDENIIIYEAKGAGWRDASTCCEYLISPNGGLEPRLDADGEPVCGCD